MSGRLFFGPAGSELIGLSASGIPVVADENGAGEMIEITKHVIDFTFTSDQAHGRGARDG